MAGKAVALRDRFMDDPVRERALVMAGVAEAGNVRNEKVLGVLRMRIVTRRALARDNRLVLHGGPVGNITPVMALEAQLRHVERQ